MSLLYFFSVIIFVCGFIDGMRNRSKRQNDVSYGSPAYKYCECGKRNPQSGGIETTELEYPWMTMITGNGSKLAGGSLINDKYIVTAAHILEHKYRMNEMKVVLGKHNVCKFDDKTVILSIEKLVVHPKYNTDTFFADIMLVKLNMKVTFNKFIRPICLPATDVRTKTPMKFGDKYGTVLGWGFVDVGGNDCMLQTVDLKISPSLHCDSNIATIICAGIINGKREDACSGDGGGPLQVLNHRKKYELIGIASSRISCGTGTSVFYTDVPHMVSWIMQITTVDSMYCWR